MVDEISKLNMKVTVSTSGEQLDRKRNYITNQEKIEARQLQYVEYKRRICTKKEGEGEG